MALEVPQGTLDEVNEGPVDRVLVVRAGHHTCALNLAHVLEVMRSMPVEPVAGAPEVVQGVSRIRGTPVPVVVLRTVLGLSSGAFTRLVMLRAGERRVALAVDEVIGIRRFPRTGRSPMPPLLGEAAAGAIETIGALDSELLLILNSARIVPGELLESMPIAER